MSEGIKVFAGRNSKDLANTICSEIGIELGRARTNLFPDGEVFVKLDDDVRGRDCFVVISTCDPVNDNLMELLVFCDCLRRASANTVTMVMPYYGYGRQDRKDEGRVPITAKLVANLITASNADRVIAMDLHAAQIQGFFDIPVDHLSATPVFYDYFMSIRDELGDLCLVSPDVGNVKVAEAMANLLSADLAIINKRRLTGDTIKVGHLIGDVKDKTVLMFDDMISTGGTVVEAAKLVKENGATDVICAATHAVLAGPAMDKLAASPISKIVVTDTIPEGDRCGKIKDKLVVLSIGEMLGQAIKRIHNNESISELFVRTAGAKR
jgi:ribose-phosphate pyrophosphokinase